MAGPADEKWLPSCTLLVKVRFCACLGLSSAAEAALRTHDECIQASWSRQHVFVTSSAGLRVSCSQVSPSLHSVTSVLSGSMQSVYLGTIEQMPITRAETSL